MQISFVQIDKKEKRDTYFVNARRLLSFMSLNYNTRIQTRA